MDLKQSPLENAYPDFRGRTVCVWLANKETREARYIVDPDFRMLGNRLFLVGTTVHSSSIPNHVTAIAWDRVDCYIVADSVDPFRAAFSAAKRADDDEKRES